MAYGTNEICLVEISSTWGYLGALRNTLEDDTHVWDAAARQKIADECKYLMRRLAAAKQRLETEMGISEHPPEG